MTNNSRPQYGPVLITGGIHKGKIGIYDDDEPCRAFGAIVYLYDRSGKLDFKSGYILTKHEYLHNLETNENANEKPN